MKEIYELEKELSIIESKINENFTEQHIINLDDGLVDTDLIEKSEELRKEKEAKQKEFIIACDKEYRNQISRATEIDILDVHIDRLKEKCSREGSCNFMEAIENLKKAIDELSSFKKC
jgi:flagellar biosynthesis component FlhA